MAGVPPQALPLKVRFRGSLNAYDLFPPPLATGTGKEGCDLVHEL